jgi:toxin HigB-1
MIVSFGDRATEDFFNGEGTRETRQFRNIAKVAVRKLDQLNAATDINDMKVPPGNRLEALNGDLEGFYSVRINDQYRVVFRFDAGNAYDVYISDHYRP